MCQNAAQCDRMGRSLAYSSHESLPSQYDPLNLSSGLTNWDAGSGEFGYWLGAEFEGNGINRIVIRCHPENTRSSAIPKRLGFTLEGTLRECTRLNGELIDMQIYSLLRREWGV